MKKTTIVALTSAILLNWASNALATEFLGYPIVAKQARFYMFILGGIGASVAMVVTVYFSLCVADLKKRAKVLEPSLHRRRSFAEGFAAAAQSAK